MKSFKIQLLFDFLPKQNLLPYARVWKARDNLELARICLISAADSSESFSCLIFFLGMGELKAEPLGSEFFSNRDCPGATALALSGCRGTKGSR